jgi:hypothetical protein
LGDFIHASAIFPPGGVGAAGWPQHYPEPEKLVQIAVPTQPPLAGFPKCLGGKSAVWYKELCCCGIIIKLIK